MCSGVKVSLCSFVREDDFLKKRRNQKTVKNIIVGLSVRI